MRTNFDTNADAQQKNKPSPLRHQSIPASKLARGLGWFSVALGVTELIAPEIVARVAGMKGNAAFIRGLGTREVACGISLLNAQRHAPYLWARVAGDAIDVTSLLLAKKATPRAAPLRVGGTCFRLSMVGALDIYTAIVVSKQSTAKQRMLSRSDPDYSIRSGFPKSPEERRDVARLTPSNSEQTAI